MRVIILFFCVLISAFSVKSQNKYEELSLLLAQSQYVELIEKAEKAIEQDSENAQFYYLQGLAYRAIDESKKAYFAFQKSVELSPDNLRFSYSL